MQGLKVVHFYLVTQSSNYKLAQTTKDSLPPMLLKGLEFAFKGT